MKWYIKVVKDNFSNFNGRATRQEFWMFYLFNFLFTVIAIILDSMLGLNFNTDMNILIRGNTVQGWIQLIYCLAISIPFLAVSIRRLHDVGKSGWMMLIIFIPLIGSFFILIVLLYHSLRLLGEYFQKEF